LQVSFGHRRTLGSFAMQVHKRFRLFLAFAVGLIASDIARSETILGRVTVSFEVAGETHAVVIPSGYRLELLIEALQSPRLLTLAPDGDLFIGSKNGRVYRLRPPYREPEVFANPGGYPHAVAFRPGEILIAYKEGLYSAPYEPGRAPLRRGEQRLLAALPAGGVGHRSRTVRVGCPDLREPRRERRTARRRRPDDRLSTRGWESLGTPGRGRCRSRRRPLFHQRCRRECPLSTQPRQRPGAWLSRPQPSRYLHRGLGREESALIEVASAACWGIPDRAIGSATR